MGGGWWAVGGGRDTAAAFVIHLEGAFLGDTSDYFAGITPGKLAGFQHPPPPTPPQALWLKVFLNYFLCPLKAQRKEAA